ncbi:MAG TPA: hypothetical protein VJ771_05045 [Candidatus Nitrosotalea sp.]|nr:hypothetical protein [Candidatus Nitrosotalea sp.]
MNFSKIIFLSIAFTFVLISFSVGKAFATDQVLITKSGSMDQIIFDGKWTFYTEWKYSSLNELSYQDGTTFELRTAHQGNFIYVFIDDVKTTHWNANGDRAIVCLDKYNNKNTTATSDDYCFVNILSGNNPVTLQGGSPLSSTDNFKRIPNPDGFIAVAAISDQNDRYTVIPHPSYEFKIPTDLVGRSADYGFYVGVYHAASNTVYSWPKNITTNVPLEIPSSSKWGELVSPDASLPEFQWPMLPLLLAIMTAIWFTQRKQSLR